MTIEDELGQTGDMVAAFDAELKAVRETLADTVRDLGNLERGFSTGLRRAFDGLLFDGDKLSAALGTLARAMSQTAYNAAMKPVTNQLGSLLADRVNGLVSGMMPFAKGGVVSGPTTFAMRGGTGLMGEAGPEAIMPLTRGADGGLGVRAHGGGAVNVTMNITTPDVQGFQRSQGQIAAQMARALGRGQRNR